MSEGADSSAWWVVATVLHKPSYAGSSHVIVRQEAIEVATADEARGKAVVNALAANNGYTLSNIIATGPFSSGPIRDQA